jgi:hypothetical protein
MDRQTLGAKACKQNFEAMEASHCWSREGADTTFRAHASSWRPTVTVSGAITIAGATVTNPYVPGAYDV